MPGYGPFLVCDFRVHTRRSDGTLSVGEAVNLYGQRRVDVIAISDPLPASPELFIDYLAEIVDAADRARRLYDMLVIPGAEVGRTRRWGRPSPLLALNLRRWFSADEHARNLGKAIERQGAVSLPCNSPILGCHLSNPRDGYSCETLLRCEKNWESIASTLRASVDFALMVRRAEPQAA